ncbi:hypothetical protein AAMO2058_000884700 [Amorphochlora amoebiformis]
MKRNEMHTLGYQGMPGMQSMGMASGMQMGGAKRHRPNNASPSKCLHVRALPYHVTETELSTLFSPFGRVEKVLIMVMKQQAFVQMESVLAATNVVNHYALVPAMLRNKAVYVQYSNHQELTASQPTVSQPQRTMSSTPANSVLMVNIENVQAPITLDNLVTIFKPYGQVLRIVTFIKNGAYKALVEMSSLEAATAAKANLEGKDMFQGCCTLHVNFSKLSKLSVTVCGAKSWDFVSRPIMEPRPTPAFGMENQLATQAGIYGYGMNPYDQKQGADLMNLGYDPYMRSTGGFMLGGHMGMGAMSQGLGSRQSGMGHMDGPVVLVSNLPEDGSVNKDHLFNLFGCYGNISRIKILYKKMSTALIQFQTPQGAMTARRNLHGVSFRGANLDVRPSKHSQVSAPKEDDPESKNLNADYSRSSFHRFKADHSNNAKNIFPPSLVLHVSNVHTDTKETKLISLFVPFGVEGFEWHSSQQKRMAFVRMKSIESSIEALMNLHCIDLDQRNIRISFSKRDPAAIPQVNSQTYQTAQSLYQQSLKHIQPAAAASTTAPANSTTVAPTATEVKSKLAAVGSAPMTIEANANAAVKGSENGDQV